MKGCTVRCCIEVRSSVAKKRRRWLVTATKKDDGR